MYCQLPEPAKFSDFEDIEQAKPSVPLQLPSSRVKQRQLKLTEITKPLSPQINESIAQSAFQRILKAERTAMLAGVLTVRQKILSSLATLYSEDLKDSKG